MVENAGLERVLHQIRAQAEAKKAVLERQFLMMKAQAAVEIAGLKEALHQARSQAQEEKAGLEEQILLERTPAVVERTSLEEQFHQGTVTPEALEATGGFSDEALGAAAFIIEAKSSETESETTKDGGNNSQPGPMLV